MELVHWPRGYGKTTKLAKIAAERGAIFITYSSERASEIKKQYPELLVYTIKQYIGRMTPLNTPVVFDDLDKCLHAIYGDELVAVSLTLIPHEQKSHFGTDRYNYY